MSSTNTNDVLNRLYAIHNRSLPKYVSQAEPWQGLDSDEAWQTIKLIVADQQRTIERLGELILENDGNVAFGEFPIAYTGLNDLSLDYLIGRMIQQQKRDIVEIAACVEQLNFAPLVQVLAKEALGAAKGHLDSLVELAEKTHSSTG